MTKKTMNVSLMVHQSLTYIYTLYILAHLLITGYNPGCQCSTYLIILITRRFKIKLSVTKCTKDKYTKREIKSLSIKKNYKLASRAIVQSRNRQWDREFLLLVRETSVLQVCSGLRKNNENLKTRIFYRSVISK